MMTTCQQPQQPNPILLPLSSYVRTRAELTSTITTIKPIKSFKLN